MFLAPSSLRNVRPFGIPRQRTRGSKQWQQLWQVAANKQTPVARIASVEENGMQVDDDGMDAALSQGEDEGREERRTILESTQRKDRQKYRRQHNQCCKEHEEAQAGEETLMPMTTKESYKEFRSKTITQILEGLKERVWTSKAQLKLAESELNEHAGKIVTHSGKKGASGHRLRNDTGLLRSGCALVDRNEPCDYDFNATQKVDGTWSLRVKWHSCHYKVRSVAHRFASTAFSSDQLMPVLISSANKAKDLSLASARSAIGKHTRLTPPDSLVKNTVKKAKLAMRGKLEEAASKLPALASEANKCGHAMKVGDFCLRCKTVL